MKERPIFLLFLYQLFLFAVFDTPIIAQTAKSAKPSASPQIKSESRPFAYTIIDNLPPNYLGHSYGDLYRALINREKVVTRGEYESTYDYKLRIIKLDYKPLIGTTNYQSRFAFTFYPDSEQFSMKYDPDTNDLDIVATWTRRFEFGVYPARSLSLTWSESSRKIGSYIGRNAFNRSVRVSVYRNDSFYLVTDLRNLETIGKTFDNRSLSSPVFMSYDGGSASATLKAAIPMTPNEARLAKLNLRILVVGHLAVKSIFVNQSRETPEITDPYDRHNFDHAINLVVEEIWIYDYPSGKVLLRFGVNDAKGKESSPAASTRPDEATPKPAPMTISDGVTQEMKIISKPRPGYTDAARQANTQGTVILSVTFLASGQVGSISTVKGLPNGLTEQAFAAARRITFEPAKKDGVAQSVTKQIEYPFSIY